MSFAQDIYPTKALTYDIAPSVHVAVRGLSKKFILHAQQGAIIDAFDQLELDAHAGECLALHGPSGSGKSTLLRSLYANYKPTEGHIFVRHSKQNASCTQECMVDMATALPRTILDVRSHTMGYVSQFLRVIPRVSCLEIVAERLTEKGIDHAVAIERAKELLELLRIPQRLWHLAPATFSGGEQQRVNIARGFIWEYPILLLDEPTASLDSQNRKTVVELIERAKSRGAAVIGIFHDEEVREAVSNRVYSFVTHTTAVRS